jgi:hypothetical protein
MAKRNITLDTKEIEEILNLLVPEVQKNTAWGRRLVSALKTIKVSSRKAKGRSLQQEVCRKLSEATCIEYDPKSDGPIMSRPMGSHGCDIILTGVAKEKIPYSIECKAQENLNLKGSIAQAKTNQVEGTDWLLVYDCKKMEEPVVMMGLEAFLKLL